ncbi:EGF-like module-containing mucin-like hormone receptor-like 3-like [Arapaima gigas]
MSSPWRNIGFYSTSFSGFPLCDSGYSGQWIRLTGIGGDVMPEFCIPSYHLHSVCNDTSCGPLAQCITGACICQPGYLAPATFLPTHDSYGCEGKCDSAF